MSKGTSRRSIRIDDELWGAAKAAALEANENLSDIIRKSLELYVSGQAIPEQAIEAAAKAIAQIETGDDGVTVANEIDRIHARSALEAGVQFLGKRP